MEEVKNPNSESQQENVPDNVDYIEALKEMKKNTVSKEAYEKLQGENKKLLQSLINGETIEGVEAPEAVDVSKLRKELFSTDANLSNLDYVTKALQLRDELIAQGKPDPFLPYGHQIAPTNEDIEAANRVAKVLQECIDYADGDSSIFTNELQRVMVDTAPRAKPARK